MEDTSNGCGQNFQVLVVSQDFQGKSLLARQRLVHSILKDIIAEIHAFSQVNFF